MKKILVVVAVVIFLVLVGLFMRGKQISPQDMGQKGTATPTEATPQTAPEKNGIISSIKDAMGLGQKMRCTYTAPDAKGAPVTSTIAVDGQKYKFTSDSKGEKLYGLFDGETQYTWTTGTTKQGWKMTKACMEELSKSVPTSNGAAPETPQDAQKSFANAENVQCVPSASEDFTVPTDVNFVDQCEMMRNSLKALDGMKGKLPAGVNIPGY